MSSLSKLYLRRKARLRTEKSELVYSDQMGKSNTYHEQANTQNYKVENGKTNLCNRGCITALVHVEPEDGRNGVCEISIISKSGDLTEAYNSEYFQIGRSGMIISNER